jgi:hypothetical protein
MRYVFIQLKQMTCIKTESRDFATGANTQSCVDFKPTRRGKVNQNTERCNLGVPKENPEVCLRFDREVVTGKYKV